jgi:glucose/arabinose dehydrogenase
MRGWRRAAGGLTTLLLLLAPGLALAQPAAIRARLLVSGLAQPVAFVQDPSNPRAQYVVQQGGRIRVVLDGVLQPFDFLDLSGVVLAGGERGLLGLALPADYGTTGRSFVNFTDLAGDTVVARFHRSASNLLMADPATRFDLRWSDGLRFIPQPFANHNGGTLQFGPDGHLYIGMGDGGSSNDPQHNAQNPDSLLGKMLRIDVHVPPGDPNGFRVPPDNPFLDRVPIPARPEIWAFGLRNPWKFSFDDPRLGGTGAMVIGDVGQGAREEIDHEPPLAGGRNYGWRLREGFLAGAAGTSRPAAYQPLTDPVFDYPRTDGQSVSGGYVYRGTALGPGHAGRYYFADFVAGRVYSIALTVNPQTGEATASDRREHTSELGGTATLGNISAIDVDSTGELYVVSYSLGRVIRIEPAITDADNDTLPDAWERRFGLDPSIAASSDGPDGDPDGDGVSNAAELAQGGHPRGLRKYYLAEGATSAQYFDLSLDLANPGAAHAMAVVRFLKSDGTVVSQSYVVPAMRRVSINPKGLPALDIAEFSTIVESDEPLVVSRQMSWDVARHYGSHMEKAVDAPSAEWFLAEGATIAGLNLFYLLQNPNPAGTVAEITFLLPAPRPPIVKQYPLRPSSRTTVWVNLEDPQLAAAEVSASIRTLDNAPIVVERAMYRDVSGQFFGAGHDGAGVTSPATEWFFAEGATGPFFDLFVLLANPNAATATGEIRYLLPDGSTITRPFSVPGRSRQTIWVDHVDQRLADTAVSTLVRSDSVPIVAERAMWWPGGVSEWYEAHVSLGSTASGTRWALAEGEVTRTPGSSADTYVLVANLDATPDTATFTLLFEGRPPLITRRDVAANSRFTLNVADAFADAQGRRFGVLVASERGARFAVEGAVYSDTPGVSWAAGSGLQGTRVP